MAQVGRARRRPLGVGGLTSGREAGALPLIGAIARNLEAEQERWFLWLPVMFGAGIALYFLLPVEPSVAVLNPSPCASSWSTTGSSSICEPSLPSTP